MSHSMSSADFRTLNNLGDKPKKQESMSLEEFKAQGLQAGSRSSGKGANKNKGNKGRGKYGAVPKTVDGIRFHSTWEADRYSQLKLLEKIGEISDLKLQVSYDLIVNDILVSKYVADFTYNHIEKGFVVEDAKGFKTPEYKIKKALMEAVNGIELYESYRPPKSSRKHSKR